ncbi:MAG: hypothetical protein E7609_04745 [Ruminococcaceae bacterium]|nr:hypothetical protein [Oscillospiraceae bacterium]
MFYTDIHAHMLCGVDDGPEDEKTMREMLDAAYQAGTRTLCLTPHYQPLFYGDNRATSLRSFESLSAYAKTAYPDMNLHLANELGYYTDCLPTVARGDCRLIGGRYLLMDFLPSTPLFTVQYAVEEMLAAGHSLLLAHIERYGALEGKENLLVDWERRGVRYQVNASAFSREASGKMKRRVKKLMRLALVHAVASDSHDLTERPPLLTEAEKNITRQFGEDIAQLLLWDFPQRILKGKNI